MNGAVLAIMIALVAVLVLQRRRTKKPVTYRQFKAVILAMTACLLGTVLIWIFYCAPVLRSMRQDYQFESHFFIQWLLDLSMFKIPVTLSTFAVFALTCALLANRGVRQKIENHLVPYDN